MKEQAIIVDIDNTICYNTKRDPMDNSKVFEDLPHWPVIEIIEAMNSYGYTMIFLTARGVECLKETREWINKYMNSTWCEQILIMREENDKREDHLVKRDLYFKHVAKEYNVLCAIDDKPEVIKMWRNLGIPSLQVVEAR